MKYNYIKEAILYKKLALNKEKGNFEMKMSFAHTIDSYNYGETKRNISNYFEDLEALKWEQARLNAGKGLTANYEFLHESKNQPYIRTGKDEFNLSALEDKDDEIKKHLARFQWAQSILSKQEQRYIIEYFANLKYEDEIIDLLGFNNSDSRAFRKLKRQAIYKFAYVLNLLV